MLICSRAPAPHVAERSPDVLSLRARLVDTGRCILSALLLMSEPVRAATGSMPESDPLIPALIALLGLAAVVATVFALRERQQRASAQAAAQFQRRIDEQERRFLFALEASNEGWWDWDAASGLMTASPRTCEIYGVSQKDDGIEQKDGVIRVPFADWVVRVHPSDRILVKNAMERHRTHGVPFDVTYRVVRADDATRWVRSRGRLIRDEHGLVIGASGFVADVTDSRLAQAAEAELSARHASVLAALPDLMFELDEALVFVRYHAPREAELVMPPEQFLGRKVDQVLPPRVALQFHDACARLRVGSAVESMEYRLDTMEAEDAQFEGRMVRISTGGFLCIIRNITERKEHEAEIRRHRDNLAELVAEQTIDLLLAKDAAERARRQQADFLASLSHELREPLHAIMGFAQMAERKGQRGEPVLDYCSRVETSAQRMLEMVGDLLDVSRAELIAGALKLEPVPWSALCLDVVRESAPMLGAKRLRAQVIDVEGVGPVRADAKRLRQVVEHLLINAIKFSPSNGAIDLRLRSVPDAMGEGSDGIELEVSDEGIGLEDVDTVRLFEAYPRHVSDDGETVSVGLGLSVCRQHVQSFGGRIEAENRVNGGAVFRVLLPAMPETVATREHAHDADGR